MAELPVVTAGASRRVQRWDAVVLGTALPGLLAAIALGKRGARVLVVEEHLAATGFPGLREPFLMPDAGADGVLGACLRDLGISLIDRRRFETRPVSCQVVLPDVRVDLGNGEATPAELASWRLADPEFARAWVRDLLDLGEAGREWLLEAPVVRASRRGALATRVSELARRGARSEGPALPPPPTAEAVLARATPGLRAVFGALLPALSHSAGALPEPARARLLAAPLEGRAVLGGGSLSGLLRRRIEGLFGEFRTLRGALRLVSVDRRPGVEFVDAHEVLTGRTLVLNAPRAGLAEAASEPLPAFLDAEPASARRLTVHLRASRRFVPDAMGERVITVRDPEQPLADTNVVRIATFDGAGGDAGSASDAVDLVASAVTTRERAAAEQEQVEREITRAVARLLPFAPAGPGGLERVAARAPRWDTDCWLPSPASPTDVAAGADILVSPRYSTYALDRSPSAALGLEGEILLGWRAGEAIAAGLG